MIHKATEQCYMAALLSYSVFFSVTSWQILINIHSGHMEPVLRLPTSIAKKVAPLYNHL